MSRLSQEGEPDVLARAVMSQPGFQTHLVEVQQRLLLRHARNVHAYHRSTIGMETPTPIRDGFDLETASEALIRWDELPRRMVGQVNRLAVMTAVMDWVNKAVKNA